MSTKLPQVHRTSKLEHLPEDLKSKAEDLIAKKFGIKETRAKRPRPFPDYAGAAKAIYGDVDESSYSGFRGGNTPPGMGGPDIETWTDVQRGIQQVAIHVSPRYGVEEVEYSIRKLLYMADRENWPREGRKIKMSYEMGNYLVRGTKVNFREGHNLTIFGCEVIVERGYHPERIVLEVDRYRQIYNWY